MTEPLSPRETEVAKAYALGASYKSVARDLGVSPATIRAHLGTIYRKLDVSSKVELSNLLRRTRVDAEPVIASGALAQVVSMADAQAAFQDAQQQQMANFMRQLDRRDQRIAALLQTRDASHAAELDVMRSEMAALRTRMADPAQAAKTRADTEARIRAQLEREANTLGADRIAEAEEAMQEDFAKADDLFAEIEARQAMEVQTAARAAFARGEIAAEEVRWLDAADHFDRAARLDPTYENLLHAGKYAAFAGRHKAALVYDEAVVETAIREFGRDDLRSAIAMGNLGLTYLNVGRFDEAEPLLSDALDTSKGLHGGKNATYAGHLSGLAVLLFDLGRYSEAEPLVREAMALEKAGFVQTDSGATSMNNLAALMLKTERFDEAEHLMREAVATTREKLGDDHPEYANALNTLASILRKMDQPAEAEDLLKRAIAVSRATIGDSHHWLSAFLNNLGLLLLADGRVVEAESPLEEALHIRQENFGDKHPNTAASVAALALLWAETGRLTEARSTLRDAVTTMGSALGDDHATVLHFQGKLAEIEATDERE